MESAVNTEGIEILTQVEVARRYSVSTQTISKWVNSSGFPHPFKIGRLLYWRIEEIKEYEAARRQRG